MKFSIVLFLFLFVTTTVSPPRKLKNSEGKERPQKVNEQTEKETQSPVGPAATRSINPTGGSLNIHNTQGMLAPTNSQEQFTLLGQILNGDPWHNPRPKKQKDEHKDDKNEKMVESIPSILPDKLLGYKWLLGGSDNQETSKIKNQETSKIKKPQKVIKRQDVLLEENGNGNQIMTYDGCRYSVIKNNKGGKNQKTYWRCTKSLKRKKCNGRAITRGDEVTFYDEHKCRLPQIAQGNNF